MNSPTVKSIDCAALYRASLEGPVEVIDVRTPEEFHEVRATLARNVPLDKVDPHAIMRERTTPDTDPIYFICAVGGRSTWACEQMKAAGYENVVNVLGGTQAWYLAGLPVEQGT